MKRGVIREVDPDAHTDRCDEEECCQGFAQIPTDVLPGEPGHLDRLGGWESQGNRPDLSHCIPASRTAITILSHGEACSGWHGPWEPHSRKTALQEREKPVGKLPAGFSW